MMTRIIKDIGKFTSFIHTHTHSYSHIHRYYVLFKFPRLAFLDSRSVSTEERIEAKRVGQFMRVIKPTQTTVSKLREFGSIFTFSLSLSV